MIRFWPYEVDEVPQASRLVERAPFESGLHLGLESAGESGTRAGVATFRFRQHLVGE
jgi:hypothetical protein